MTNRDIDDRSDRAAEAARAWGASEAGSGTDAALGSVRAGANATPSAGHSDRRLPVLLGAAAATIGVLAGAAVLIDRLPGDDTLVPADTAAVSSIVDSVVVPPSSVPTPTDPVATPVTDPVTVDPTAPRTFVIDMDEIGIQNAFPVNDAVMRVGAAVDELGRDERPGPPQPAVIDRDTIVVADPVNGRVQVVAPYAVAANREEFTEGEGFVFVPAESLPIFADPELEPDNIMVGQAVIGPAGNDVYVPVRGNLPSGFTVVSIDRFERGGDFSWQFVDSFPVEAVPVTVDDEFVFEGRSLVHVESGAVVAVLGPDSPFVPIVREESDGWSVTDEAGIETLWSVPFDGHASGLADGSVVIAGARDDTPAADSDAALLRLWPDGASALSRFSAGNGFGFQQVTAEGAATITTTDDGDWLIEAWPLPARAAEPQTQPNEDIGDCGAIGRFDGPIPVEANGYVFPWTVSGGPAGANGAYVAVYDALGRTVIGGGCSSGPEVRDQIEVRGASYLTYGDSLIVALAEPLSLGGVANTPEWLGAPIAEGIIESLASEVKVYRVPDDRELPQADNDNTFLLVQIRGARLINISSSGISTYSSDDDVAPVADPLDLQNQATEFAQGYLDALAEGRWDDAVIYIENNGRNWVDRPAFADLYALVGEEVGSGAALERWCTQERDCTRGVANGVLEQLNEGQVSVAITFEVPGGPMFEQTINPLWTVGSSEGRLYIDGLPQVAR